MNNEATPIDPKAAAKTGNPRQEFFSFLKTLAIFIVAAIVLRASVVEAFKIPSGSMIPALMIGDHLLVTKLNYGFRLPFVKRTLLQWDLPKRGDIVVFTRTDDPHTPAQDESGVNIIKRVIGLPGDTIEVRDRTVLINNQVYNEPYEVRWEEGGHGHFGPVKVPEGKVLLLGDNRDKSNDSRYWGDGPFLDSHLIKGKAQIIYWSWDSWNRIGKMVR